MMRLEDTSGNEIAAAIAAERHRIGSPATGMVLTLLILANEECQSDATAAAIQAAHEHPMRVLTLIPRPGKQSDQETGGDRARLDAEISVGGDEGPGEVAVLRLRGELSTHANSVAIPLLLPDTPVVAWWPVNPPRVPGEDLIGAHAQRRITDAAAAEDPLAELRLRAENYLPGDSDLAWTRITSWRSAIAAILDDPAAMPSQMTVEVDRANPSGALLIAWLRAKLGIPVHQRDASQQGIITVSLDTGVGEIVLRRLDHESVSLERPGVPASTLAMARREPADLMREELRRLDSDDVYHEVLQEIVRS